MMIVTRAMTRVAIATLLLVVFGPIGYTSGPPKVRVLTYNIHHGEGMDGRFDLPRLAEVITRADPDLVSLQEVDRGTERADGVDQLAELERLTGMHGAFGKAMNFQGGAYGVAILSKQPILGALNQPLPDVMGREPRTVLSVRVRVGDSGPGLQFANAHLDQGRDSINRLVQANFLNTMLSAAGAPAILAGDMNARPGTSVMELLTGRWTSFFTPPASVAPRGVVDHVLAFPASDWRAVDAQLIDDRVASDHRPVLVVLEWAAAASN